MELTKTLNFIDELEELENEERENEAWKIEDLESADWAMKKIKQIDEELEIKLNYANSEIEKYKKFINQVKEEAERQRCFFEYKIQEYCTVQKVADPKFKLKTAQGTANWRKKTTWNYQEDRLLQFLKDNELNELIRVKEEINKADLKKVVKVTDDGTVVTNDGEILEGVQVTTEEVFNIRLS